MVIGSVNKIKIGRTNTFNNANNAATTIEVKKSSTLTPGKILDNVTTKMAVTTS